MMATYFNGGSEIQADNLQTLFLMNRGYSSDYPQPPPGVLLFNPTASAAAPNHHLVGIPLAGDEISTVGSPAGVLQGQLVPRFHYNLWSGAGDHQAPAGEFRRPAPVTLAATSSASTQGGLSLSLNNSSVVLTSPGSGTPTSASGASPIVGSKFLKAAQLLLDEVVNVGKAIDNSKPNGCCKVEKVKAVSVGEASSSAAELSTAQRQELHMKKAKLLNMLDEVEQRYRQYNSQMQMVAASFEQAAGAGSAKSYTQLALQTISKQFRCLKDAIEMQIKGTGKSMGEGEEEDGEQGRSRLRMVDHQMRQQRAMQQLGMMHHNAWRPQRGLPERAVSVLRAWLFEHFLHPYPKDSDKHMLAKQTGLTRSQVSNWFINARVRLWKPMVEEMYVEEMKSHEQNNSETDHNKDMVANSPKPTPPLHSTHNHSFNQNPHQELLTPNNDVVLSSNPTMMGPPRSPKRQRMMMNTADVTPTINLPSMDKEMKPGGRELFPPNLIGFGSYPIDEIGSRFNPDHHQHQHQHQYQHGNAVSLTLGLPHDCDQQQQQEGYNFEDMNIDVQNRKRFAAQLLPDYVT